MDMDEKEYLESLRKRARRFKLKVLCDRRTDSYCIVNAENNYVIVPPTGEFAHRGSVAGRLREGSSQRMTLQGQILAVKSVLWYNMSVVQALF